MNYAYAPLVFVALSVMLLVSCEKNNKEWQSLMANGLDDFEILNGKASYQLEKGVLIGTTILDSPNTFLATKKKYADFELKFEVLLTAGLNSGVQFRSISDSTIMRGRVHGYQVEIEDSPRGWAGGIYDEARRGWIYPLERNPKGRKAFRKEAWNSYHIVAKGDTLKTWVNGIPCANLIDTLTSEGFIAFQVHSIGNDTSQTNQTISWRNIQICTTAVGEGLEDFPSAPQASIISAASNSTEEFLLQPGFHIHQLAAEPQVQAPVAANFDERGNLWVVELPGYMRDVYGSDEDKADGKIVVLSDLNNDGIMDRRELYKNDLVAPRALCLAYNGLLYNNGKALYFDDFATGATELVDSFYVQGGNIEHQPNGLFYNLDNWIYSAKSNARYRLKNGQWEKQATSLRGQWGINGDELGRLVYNDNSNGLFGDKVMPNTLLDNPYLRPKENIYQQLCKDNRVYPYQATAVNRGYIDNVLDEEGKLKSYTSACSPLIYKGAGKMHRDAFACAPEVNLIKRYSLKNKSAFAQEYVQTYQDKEFLLSTDETFRPVNIYNQAKEGMLLVDMRKGVIQHRAYMTNYLLEKIRDKKMDQVVGKGRLYLISESSDLPKDLATWGRNESLANKVKLLAHPNGALRLAMQKHLVANDFPNAEQELRALLSDQNPFATIHALWTLQAVDRLTSEDLNLVLQQAQPEVIYQLLTLLHDSNQELSEAVIEKAIALKHREVDLLLAAFIPNQAANRAWLQDLVRRYQNSPTHAEALIARKDQQLEMIIPKASVLLEKMQTMTTNKKNNRKVSPAIITYQYSDNRNEGFPAYNQYCVSCHGADGMGQEGLAPPLLYSEFVEGPSHKLAALILQGLQGPVHVNGKLYDMNLVMPGLKNNPEVDDKTIAAIIAFVNNAFSKSGESIQAKEVAKIRERLKDRKELLSEEEVLSWK